MPTPTLKTLLTFNVTNGEEPVGGLVADAAGDLFGAAAAGGANGDGDVFELVDNGGGTYTPSTLASFNGTNGSGPQGSLFIDAAGNLVGTAADSGANFDGTVFEIKNNGTPAAPNYAGTPTLLVTFNYTNGATPAGGLIADAAGDLFGMTAAGGAGFDGTVFEIKNNGTHASPSYASTPMTLVSFNGTNGQSPFAGLFADAAGDLFGTTAFGGTNDDGTVFEMPNTGTTASPSYASTPISLASFNGTNGESPEAVLIADAAGNLFGTTEAGGLYGESVVNPDFTTGDGTVFELKNNGGGSYTLMTLVNFNSTDGALPLAGLIADAAGNLFGTTSAGGANAGGGNGDGTVFEIKNNGTPANPSYASTLTTLFSFNGTDGAGPVTGLIADASGNLFGTTEFGGTGYTGVGTGDGTVFELTATGFQVALETVSLTGPAGTLGSSAAAAAKFVVTGNLDADYTGSLTLTDGTFSTALAYTGNGTYTANLDTWADGTVSASLAVSHPAGNSFSASASAAIDPDYGDAVILTGPLGTLGSLAAAAAKFVVTGNLDGETGSLTLTDGTFSTALAYTGDGTYTANLDTWADGTVSASLAVSDPAGNSFSATATAAIDPDFGDAATVSGPAGTLGSLAAAAVPFVVTGNLDGETGSLTLTDGTFSTALAYTGNGTYTANLDSWADGTVSASLAVSDPAGNSFSASANAAIDPDHGDAVTLTGPLGTLGSSAAAAAAFTVTGNLDDETGSLTLSDGTFSTALAYTGNGTYTANLDSWADGTVSATLAVSDPAGNSFSASASAAIDPDFGDAVTLTGPAGTLGSSAAAAAAFTVTGNLDDETGSLTLTDGTFSTALAYTGDGTYTADLDSWADGTVSASLAVSDLAGNSFSASASAAIDPDHGDAVTLTGPAGTLGSSAAATAKFVVTGNLDDETGSLTLTDGASSTALAYTGNGTYTANLETWQNGTVSASLAVSDPAGNSFSASATAALHVAPTVTAGATVTFTGAAVTLDGALTVSDTNSGGILAGATVAIGTGFLAGDTLIFANQNGITGTYNASTGVLALTGTDSLANYQAALESISFSSTSNNPSDWGADLSRTVSWTVTDGTLSSDPVTSTIVLSAPPPPSTPAGTSADMILRNSTNGNYEIYDIGNNAILAAAHLNQVALEWQVAGLGGFHGTDTSDMILRDGNTGAFEVYDISNNMVTSAAALGQVGLEWQVSGFGDFSSHPGETDMLMRSSSTGAFEVYDISNNAITSAAAIGAVGLEWTVAGFGDFSSNPGESDMLMRDSSTGAFEVYDISHNALTSAAAMGAVGLEWTVAGFGDFSGNPNETDMLLRNNNTAAFEVYDISHNAITSAAPMGAVGLEWQVAGFGDFSGNPGETDMLMQAVSGPDAGDFEYYDISSNQITGYGPMGQVGLEWQVGGIANDPPAAASTAGSIPLLVQAMASFGASAAANSAPGAVPGGADTSQQTLLTMPQHT